jgi:hypothetical protein
VSKKDKGEMKVAPHDPGRDLRRARGGLFLPWRAPALAATTALAVFLFLPLVVELSVSMQWLAVVGGIAAMSPPACVSTGAWRRNEHRAGFPISWTLVVCADPG